MKIIKSWKANGRGCVASSRIVQKKDGSLEYRGSSATGKPLYYPHFSDEKEFYGEELCSKVGKQYKKYFPFILNQ